MRPAPDSEQRARRRKAPARIVSLVPSVTESLFALGLGSRVVGVTDWCVHPREAVARLPKLGGTKTPSIARILELAPDLVIANREENRRRDIDRLEAAGVSVWVTYPRSVREGAALLRELAALGAPAAQSARVVAAVDDAVEHALAQRPAQRTRVFCAIWKRPWMVVGGDTYANDLIEVCGGLNVFATHGERRYPIVDVEQMTHAQPEVILLPDEPYAFGPRDVAELAALDVPAVHEGRVHLLDGTLLSWYGPRIQRALAVLRPLLGAGAAA